MGLPMKGDKVDTEEFSKMVDTFIENGFNYFDTAHGYLGGLSETAIKECLTSRYPRDQYGRPGTADEVANVAELLMSDKGAFITGSDFLIDGGATASYFYGPLKPEESNVR